MITGDCEGCPHKATIFLTQIIDGKVKKVKLCDQCPLKEKVEDSTAFSLAEELLGKAKITESDAALPGTVCPSCGFTAEKLQKVGRLGCSECYTVFADQIGPIIESLHKNTEHVGKSPPGFTDIKRIEKEINHLQEDLRAAIENESYEKAAALRDEIRTLEKQQNSFPEG